MDEEEQDLLGAIRETRKEFALAGKYVERMPHISNLSNQRQQAMGDGLRMRFTVKCGRTSGFALH
jgi:hypothetical protein